MASPTTAVIGAGIAGVACARRLDAHAPGTVTVFDKGRGHGGRLAQRRTDAARFDHGAQYLTARGAAFRAVVDGWRAAGVAAPWGGRIVTLADGVATPARPDERFVGVPGMSALVRDLAGPLPVRHGVRVAAVEPASAGPRWRLRDEAGADLGAFDRVVIAAPAPQAADLLPVPALAARARQAGYAPCWAAMLTFAAHVEVPYDGATLTAAAGAADADDAAALGWIAREASKPGREATEAWTVHARPAWTRAHLEADRADVAARLARAFTALTGAPAPIAADAHRWRYALVDAPLGEPCLVDAAAGVAACGDWCLGPRIELAFDSGLAAAAALGA